ncbi:MAG: glycosyltransferase [Candidatus Alcyoniella australis]|nr:glycosyltransferase [Candidatus Alcyoniella australis]
MRILHVIHDNPFEVPGGAQSYSASLALEQAVQGHECALFFLDRNGRSAGKLVSREHHGLKLFSGNIDRMPRLMRGFQFRNSYDNPDAFKLFQTVFEHFQPQLVHVHSLILLSYRIPQYVRSHHAKLLWTLHDYWPVCHRIVLLDNENDLCHGSRDGSRCVHCGKPGYNRWPGSMLKPAFKSAFARRNSRLLDALHQAHRLLAPSQYLQGVYRKLGAPADRLIHSIYGIRPLPRLYAREPKEKLRFGFLGNPAAHKGTIELARCFGSIHNAGLTFYGPTPRGRDLIQIIAAAPEDVITFHGPYKHQDTDKVLRTIDVLVVPSLWQENSPLVIHEALSAGIPVLAFAAGGIQELVQPGVNGWLLPTADFPALARTIAELAAEPLLVDQMSLGAALIRPIDDDARTCIELAEID